MRAASLVLGVPLLLFGCVSSSTHEELKSKYDAAQAQLESEHVQLEAERAKTASLEQQLGVRDREVNARESELSMQRQRVADLERQRKDQSQKIVSAMQENDRLREELAKLVKDRSKLKDSTARLRDALAELAQRKAEADRRVADFRELLDRFKTLIDAGQLRVQIVDGRMVLTLPSDVLFDSGSAKLSRVGRDTVMAVAKGLSTMGERRFQVEGHTDNVPISNTQYASNWELAAGRAIVVVKAMIEAGMPSQAVSAASFGEFHPAMSNDTDVDRAVNRRIEIVVVPDLSSLPGFEELKQAVETNGS